MGHADHARRVELVSDRSAALTTVKGGINRQRVKGAALSDALYDLLNGYITKSRTIVVRPGTFRHAELSIDTLVGTRGLASFDGNLHIFSASVIPVPTGFVLHVIAHPTDPTIDLDKIWFAAPFLGFLYVVAEFTNGDVFHFWLQSGGSWAANTMHRIGDVVQPTVPNGLLYRAVRLSAANPVWAPGVARAVNDVVEPTTYNGFKYTVIEADGPATSGATEPVWPTVDGGQVNEDSSTTSLPSSTPTTGTNPETPGTDVIDRYGTGNQ